MKTRALAAAVAALFSSACGQTIVVVQCDGHAGEDRETPDAGADDRGHAEDAAEPTDAGGMDALPGMDVVVTPDGGPSCGRYCIRSVSASSIRVNVREPVTLTPTVENPGNVVLSYSVKPAQIPLTRGVDRPAAVLSELTISLSVDPTSGAATFRLDDVPPWFMSTTFELAIYAKGPAPGDPEVSASALVTVRGNALYSSFYNGDYRVFGLASDGRPTTATDHALTHGELLSTLVRTPRGMLLRKNGHLLVYDDGLTPPGILEFELTGHDQQTSSFAVRDGQNMPLFDDTNSSPYQLAELLDGRIAMVDTVFSRNPTSRLVLFKADGTFDRVIVASSPTTTWSGVAIRENGEILLPVRDSSMSRVERYDPTTTQRLMPDFIENLPATVRAVLGVPGGGAYVAGDGYVLLIGPTGSRSAVSPLPGSTSTYWRVLAPYEPGRVLAGNDETSETEGLDLIEGRTWVRPLRAMGAGNFSTNLYGGVFLE
ncbi:MAG: hypothetical protein U1E65_23510 [Myxococcota bacterium]